ncbi:hypothetical protein [Nocardia sp. NRRL S-836]|uniref:hypothetical protein n=1 Tax=Nocardia sp. NRRL S-836 TaxID=1519492 RepID=UPI0006AF47C8|nr:hypothetical protein [Nocardia sp. NRRL S-836]KOV84782.1 hypothetical protein ADL03_16085 [Nocardia sp. NRRL S-836]
MLACFHLDHDAHPSGSYSADEIEAFKRGDWHFHKACWRFFHPPTRRKIAMTQVEGVCLEDIEAADGMRRAVHDFVMDAFKQLKITPRHPDLDLPRWPQVPPSPIELDEFTLRLWYGVALPADCDDTVHLTFAHDIETDPNGLSPAGLAQFRRGEWSYYSTTASVSDATGDVVASRVARGLRREDLYDSEAAYAVTNDAVFAAIENWAARRS